MTEIIVSVPDDAVEHFIARFGIEGTTMYGYQVVGEIVRCKDCEHIVWTDNPMTSTHYWCIENDRPCALDGFCSLAERRENGDIESIYDWQWVRDLVGEDEAERRKEKQKAVGE